SSTMTQPSSTAGAVGIKQKFPIWAKVVIACVGFICLAFVAVMGMGFLAATNGYSGEQNTSDNGYSKPAAMKEESLFLLNFSMPSDWTIVSDDDTSRTYEPACGGKMMVSLDGNVDFPTDTDAYIKKYVEVFDSGTNADIGDLERSSLGDALVYTAPVTQAEQNGTFKGYVRYVMSGHALYSTIVIVPESAVNLYDKTLKDIINSMNLPKAYAPMGADDGNARTGKSIELSANISEQKKEEPAPVIPQETAGQKNALKSAKSYLKYSSFSYTGLIEQLEYEKFSIDDATYAADNCGADWMIQAEKSAASYLKYSSFSHGGLVEQLVYEGFTPEQAEHGATSTGL
ncbi:MAG: Ltp family lipoprotein, partial [Gordonibacter sp.]|uniref:Ltp family lipoprotein n=1 Tax=Gordonibacter sp. TaxID=1968902 RepID=UPI002FCC2AAA